MTDTPPLGLPDPRAGIRRVYDAMAIDIETQLRAAPAAQRSSLIVKYMPMLAKQLEEAEVDDELEVLRSEMADMRGELRVALLSRTVPETPLASLPPRDG